MNIFNKYKFATVTIEHDIYTGNYFDTRRISRDIFIKNGYILVFQDVKVNFENKDVPFEDWYVHPDLVDIDYANNPVYYYNGLMNYLNVDSLSFIIVNVSSLDWKNIMETKMSNLDFVPHYIILEIFDGSNSTPGNSGIVTNKEKTFVVGEYTYVLDSCIIRDVEQQHFTATLTCEGKEMAYDGASFHRLVPMKWKNRINTNNRWKFKGTEYPDGRPLYWSFRQGYQMLFYYRTK